jgi:hypothetical protein
MSGKIFSTRGPGAQKIDYKHGEAENWDNPSWPPCQKNPQESENDNTAGEYRHGNGRLLRISLGLLAEQLFFPRAHMKRNVQRLGCQEPTTQTDPNLFRFSVRIHVAISNSVIAEAQS